MATLLQSSCLEHSMDRGAWWATVPGVAKSQTRLSDFHFHFSLSNSVGAFLWEADNPNSVPLSRLSPFLR